MNEFRREAYRLYEELRGLIRHGVASTIFRVTVQKQPPPEAALAQSLAQGVAALAGAQGGNGAHAAQPASTGAATATATAATGSAIAGAGAAATGPGAGSAVVRDVRASLGDQPLTPGSGNGVGGARPGYTPTGERIGRNDPCWCGSGAKYKKCHGR